MKNSIESLDYIEFRGLKRLYKVLNNDNVLGKLSNRDLFQFLEAAFRVLWGKFEGSQDENLRMVLVFVQNVLSEIRDLKNRDRLIEGIKALEKVLY